MAVLYRLRWNEELRSWIKQHWRVVDEVRENLPVILLQVTPLPLRLCPSRKLYDKRRRTGEGGAYKILGQLSGAANHTSKKGKRERGPCYMRDPRLMIVAKGRGCGEVHA